MIANARMYSVNQVTAAAWRDLLCGLAQRAGIELHYFEHASPAPIEALWRRSDLGAVFMCGLPFARAEAGPAVIAAPIPAPLEFAGRAEYWSEYVVPADSAIDSVEASFGGRLALTTPHSQSGCSAALADLMRRLGTKPGCVPLCEVIAAQITPQAALRAVADGRADIAPIDAYSLCLLRKHERSLTDRVRSVGRTASCPIPPLVAVRPCARLTEALLGAEHDPDARAPLETLELRGFTLPDASRYAELPGADAAATCHWRQHRLADVIDPAFRAAIDP
jgi:ABC-type phosphate/phosphonate transport system substrate-binding protein